MLRSLRTKVVSDGQARIHGKVRFVEDPDAPYVDATGAVYGQTLEKSPSFGGIW